MLNELELLLICNALKGSATKVITAFLMAGTALDIEGLIKWTRMERHSIDTALKQLKDYGLVVRQVMAHNRAIWMLVTNVFPVMRTIGGLGNDREASLTFQNEGIPHSVVVVVNDSDLDLKVPTITTTTTTTSAQNEGIPHSGIPEGQGAVSRTPAEWAALVAALKEHKIIGSKRRALIECEWVTGEYVCRSVKHAIDERLWDQPVGMAINRMLEGLDVPEEDNSKKLYHTTTVNKGKRGIETISYTFDVDQEAADFTGHEKGCKCMDCSVYRTNGERMLCPNCKHYRCECEEE